MTGTSPRLLVVGHGMVADRLIDELDARSCLPGGDRPFDLTVVGEEGHPVYNRILLSHVLAGDDPDSISYRAAGWAEQAGIRRIAGRWVQRLDTDRKVALVGNDEEIPYDVAVLATGSTPVLPSVTGVRTVDGRLLAGIHVYRTMADCLGLRAAAGPGAEVVVVGGGLLGLEAADVLRRVGCAVTIVHPTPTLLDVQLDDGAGAMLGQAIAERDIDVAVGRVRDVLRDPSGTVHAVQLADEQIIGADIVVLTVGVRPRTSEAAASGITVERGVVVDDTLATSAADVYAIGDCAEHRGVCNGLVSSGWEQAAVLAERLAGSESATYHGQARATRLKVAGIEVAAMGVRDPGPDDEVLTTVERRRRVYRRLIIRGGRLTGAIVYGDPQGAATIIGVYDRQGPLPDQPLDLFCSSDAFRSAGGGIPTVCTCNQVDEAAIATAIEAGATTVADVGTVTRAGTGCGTCCDRIAELLTQLTSAPAV